MIRPESLSNCRPFSELTKEQLELILSLCLTRTVEKNAVIFREGGPARFFSLWNRGESP